MMTNPSIRRVALGVALLCSTGALAQTQTQIPPRTAPTPAGTVERIKVHGASLEGSLLGDSPDRDVAVFLPPSYKTERNRRYPVLYLLHGFTDDIDHWWGVVKHFVSVPDAMNKALAGGATKELILVMPNAYTRYQGSMYSNSAATGNWEDFVASDLVTYIDRHYRTIANVNSRGLAGHSMGGYGAMRIGMRHPDVFSSVYAMSACCMTPPPLSMAGADPQRVARLEAMRTPEEVNQADFGTKAMFASAAAWSPNPTKPPLYIDWLTENGELRPQVAAKWAANAVLAMIDQYIANLKRLHALGIDVGIKDGLARDSEALHQILTAYQIRHDYEAYDGDHLNRIAERLETKVFPFFSTHLATARQ